MAAGAYSEFREKKRTFGKPPAARKGVKPSYEDKEETAAWVVPSPARSAFVSYPGNHVKISPKREGCG